MTGTLVALTHLPSRNLQGGERTYVGRDPIDPELALRQHERYRDALRACGASVMMLDDNRELPDSVFVEDTAIVLDEVAVIMSMGAESRRAEVPAIERALRAFRHVEHVRLPATIDGGDVVRSGRALYVGASPRTNAAGIQALREIVQPFGYTVTEVPVHGCLHLKSGCSALPDGRFLVNPEWIDVRPLDGALVRVPASEPWAGDVLTIDSTIIVSDAFPETITTLRDDFRVIPVSVSEFAKAEGGVTCLSLVFSARA
jgi:dimethylargininase